jgi:butyrate kinase
VKRRTAPTILVINPGSTSTRLAVFSGRRRRFETTVDHTAKQTGRFRCIMDQQPFRERLIRAALRSNGVDTASVDVFVGRGGLLRPLPGGVYAVNAAMLQELRAGTHGEHASNLGAVLARALAKGRKAPVYIVDPPVVDELAPVARLTGLPELPRRTAFHALNQKAVAERAAQRLGKPYARCRLIVAHVGGGVSVGVHRGGRVVEVNNALDGEGAFSVERTGALPLLPFARYIRERGLFDAAVRALVTRRGGLLAHLGTNDVRVAVSRAQAGDRKARAVLEGFVYQLARSIAAGAAVLDGRVDGVVLTGAVMKSAWVRNRLRRKIRFLGPVFSLPGSFEMQALAGAALDAYLGRRRVRSY